MSAVNTSSYVVHHSSGKLKDIKHSFGNITGLTLVDFINLPNKARIGITYAGESVDVLGFLGLKKLWKNRIFFFIFFELKFNFILYNLFIIF